MRTRLTETIDPGLYIHVPLCRSKCFYCDFYSRPSREPAEAPAFVDALLREYELRAVGAFARRSWRTVYIGGGTPSILPIPDISRLLQTLTASSRPEEITIEANPEDVHPQWLSAIKDMGIDRVSMGVQSFSDNELKAVGRRHDGADALRAARALAHSGLNYSLDLIYGLPGQDMESWLQNLNLLFALRPYHFSAYLLSYEPGTRLYARLMKGEVVETSDALATEMYRALCREARRHGYEHYEISNFALPGYHSRHNSAYWEDVPYLGLGPGAHSFDGERRGCNPPDLKGYCRSLLQDKSPYREEPETEEEKLNDFIITSLRTARGLSPLELERLPAELTERLMRNLEAARRKGMVRLKDNGSYVIPEKSWLISDAILRDLIV